MNCKENDLAICVRSYAGNAGKIMTCLRLATLADIGDALFLMHVGPVWVVDRPIPTNHGRSFYLIRDAWLYPIRPDAEPVTNDVVAEVGA